MSNSFARALTAAEWRAGHPIEDHLPAAGATVVGLGEGAHFVREFNELRAEVSIELVDRRGFTHLALEVGPDEAPRIEAWLRRERTEPLVDLIGPLSFGLYGTYLTIVRDRLGPEPRVTVLGVDAPNSLTLEPTLRPLAELLQELDPESEPLVTALRRLSPLVHGGSAAASALSWAALDRVDQDDLTVTITRLAARVRTLRAVRSVSSTRGRWRQAERLVEALATTDLMLRAMADLFAGAGLEAETSLREHFIATSLLASLRELPKDARVLYVAHNNHVQKAPVMFDGVLAAYPAGLYLARALGERYASIGLSHLGEDVPEMVVPAENAVGFRVETTPAAAVEADSVEAAAVAVAGAGRVVVKPDPDHSAGATGTIRSQSARSEVPAEAFDLTIVVRSASPDPTVRELAIDG